MDRVDIILCAREATRTQHEHLEAVWPFDEAMDFSSYRAALAAFLGLFEPLEQLVAEVDLPAELAAAKRRRTSLLIQDLRAMGLAHAAIDELPRCQAVPPLRSTASALGCMYVLEGSTLGGQYIARMVHERLGLTDLSGCSFFYSYGPDVGNMWRQFCQIVREKVETPQARQEFVEAAQSTFATFERWLECKHDQFTR